MAQPRRAKLTPSAGCHTRRAHREFMACPARRADALAQNGEPMAFDKPSLRPFHRLFPAFLPLGGLPLSGEAELLSLGGLHLEFPSGCGIRCSSVQRLRSRT